MKRTAPLPLVGTTPPRNEFGPRELQAVLELLARRQQVRAARLGSITRLRGGYGQ